MGFVWLLVSPFVLRSLQDSSEVTKLIFSSATGMPQSQTPFLEMSSEAWEDVCQDYGFEWVDFESKGRNEFAGEFSIETVLHGALWTKNISNVALSEPMGLERLKEALEANDWAGGEEYGGEIDFDNLEEDDEADETGSLDFGIGREEMKEEMAGMKRAIYGGGNEDEDDEMQDEDEEEVEKLQAMMLKMQAVRGRWTDPFAVKQREELMCHRYGV